MANADASNTVAAPTAALERLWAAAFESARRSGRAPCRAHDFRIAGRPVRVETVGRRLHDSVTAAVRHLEREATAADAPQLHVRVWDAEETGVPGPFGPLSGDPDADESLQLSDDGRLVTDRRGQWAATLDRRARTLTGCTGFHAPRPLLHDLGKPLQTLLAVWCYDRGAPLVHAGLVCRRSEGVLLGGTGGSGKSTTALACVDAGFDFLGDDRIALERRADRFIGHSLFSSLLIDAGQLARFPRVAERAIPPAHHRERKPLVFLDQAYPARMGTAATVRAVALLRVGARASTSVRPARAAEALLHVAPSSLVLPLGPGTRGMARIAELLRAVPSFWVELGRDVEGVAAAIDSLLDRAQRGG